MLWVLFKLHKISYGNRIVSSKILHQLFSFYATADFVYRGFILYKKGINIINTGCNTAYRHCSTPLYSAP